MFPCFEKHSISTCIHARNGCTYSKYVHGRFLIPYIDELKQYSKALYIDNDYLVLQPLDKMFSSKSSHCATMYADGQDKQPQETKTLEILKKHDHWNTMKSCYYCSGVLMFNMSSIDMDLYNEFMHRSNEMQEAVYSSIKQFYAD